MSIVHHFDIDAQYIEKIINLFTTTALNQFNLSITEDEEKEIVLRVTQHYIDHANEYKVRVKSTDPFKFIAWAGLILYNEIKKESIKREIYLATAVATMLYLLKKNDKSLDIKFVQKLLIMAKHDETAKNHLAIGKNGLYMAFRSANEVMI